MIYVSSACVRNRHIADSVRELADNGFNKIELSGGTLYSDDILESLIRIKSEYELDFLAHNYFPPPKEAFVLNLAATRNETSDKSLIHCKSAIDMALELGSPLYGFHAGFLIDVKVEEIGQSISKSTLSDRHEAVQRFNENCKELARHADGRLDLYIENNVVSNQNFRNFEGVDPFLLTSSTHTHEIESIESDMGLILDLAHLYVSCKTLGQNFLEEFDTLQKMSDYFHISDNDGMADSNNGLKRGSAIFEALSSCDLKERKVTLEVYDGIQSIKETYSLVKEMMDDR